MMQLDAGCWQQQSDISQFFRCSQSSGLDQMTSQKISIFPELPNARFATKSHKKPQKATKSHKTPQNATKSHKKPQTPQAAETPQTPQTIHKKILDRSRP
jgi:hypothetical protein